MSLRLIALVVCLGSVAPCLAQRRVEPENRHERIICLVPMVGEGTYDDPRRPMFVPNPNAKDDATRDRESKREGLLGYAYEVSDDGRLALVEFVASDREAFQEILESRHPEVKVFRKGEGRREEIESELKRFKRDFDPSRLKVAVP